MILKYISIPQLNFENSLIEGIKKIKKLPKFDRYMSVFWLLGPFIYLIERSPADIWLSFIGICFLFKCILEKNWQWASQLWVKITILFWLTVIISAILSPDPLYSFSHAFVWIRFPLYAAALQVWLARDRDIRIVMLICILVGMILMCSILTLEMILEPKIRLTWPYGDTVPGGYLAKVCLPIFCVLVAIITNGKLIPSIFSTFIGLITICISALTGERTHFLLRACVGILAGLVWKPKLKIIALIVLAEIILVSLVFYIKPDLGSRYTTQFASQIPLLNTVITDNKDYGGYWGAWRGGIQQFTKTPIIGIGPNGTRNTCKNLAIDEPEWLPGINYCGNHPHNFYIQLAAETGLIGLILGSMLFISIIYSCYRIRQYNLNCPMASTAFVIPFGLFFPIQQFGSFFGQWGNLFLWFSIAFAISQIQDWDKKIKS